MEGIADAIRWSFPDFTTCKVTAMTRTRGALGALGAAVIAWAATCCASGGAVYNAGADSVGADSTGCAEPPVITEEEYLQLDFAAAAEISELNAETMSGHPSWTNEIMRRYQYQLRDEGCASAARSQRSRCQAILGELQLRDCP
jgi:hypothetical protein